MHVLRCNRTQQTSHVCARNLPGLGAGVMWTSQGSYFALGCLEEPLDAFRTGKRWRSQYAWMFRGVGDVLPAAPLVTARCSTYWCQVSSACPFVPERQNVPKKVSKPYGFDRSTTKRPVSCQLLSFCGEAKSLPLRASLSHASALIASGAEDPQELCQAVPSSQDVGGAPRAFKFQQRAKTYANSRYSRKQISKCDVVSLDHEVAMSFLYESSWRPRRLHCMCIEVLECFGQFRNVTVHFDLFELWTQAGSRWQSNCSKGICKHMNIYRLILIFMI